MKSFKQLIREAVVPHNKLEGHPYPEAPQFKAIVRTATVGTHSLKIISSVDEPLKGFSHSPKIMKANYKVNNSYRKTSSIEPHHARDILHTVIHSIKNDIETHKPDALKFDAVDQDNNPNYEALAHHLAKHYNGSVSHEMVSNGVDKVKNIKKFTVHFHKP